MPHFSTSFSDADLFFIQLIASQLDANLFVKIFFERFHVLDLCKSVPNLNSPKELPSHDQMSPNQQIKMLTSALTLFAQVVAIKPNLTLNSYELTRIEIINLLCVADRTYSEIEDNLPDVCNLAMSKKEIDKILHEVADFIDPMAQEHGLKQGIYAPKDHIWTSEYDPLYVMLRSIYIIEFQKSFDRYCNFIKRKHISNASNLWPPFRLLTSMNTSQRPHDQLSRKFDLLNTKCLHGVLFTLLYWYANEIILPEKVLYFIVYILELAVMHATPDDVETDDSTSHRVCKEGNYDTWFESNNIFDNLCRTIGYVSYENGSMSVAACSVDDQARTFTNANKIFQSPPFKKVCSVFPFLAAKTSNDDEPKSSCNDNYQATNVYALDESMLSLLVKIMNKLCSRGVGAKLSQAGPCRSDCSANANKARIGDEYHFVSGLVNRIAESSSKCRRLIEKLDVGKKQSARALVDSMDKETMQRAKATAKARQTKLMAQMQSHQNAFLLNANNDDPMEPTDELQSSLVVDDRTTTVHSTSSAIEATSEQQELFDCCICRVSTGANVKRPIGLITFLQPSSVLGHRIIDNQDDVLTVPHETCLASKDDIKCWILEKSRCDAVKSLVNQESFAYAFNIGWKGGVYTQSCGHYLHYDCYNSYKDTQLANVNIQQNFRTFLNDRFFCPLCRRIANTLLPMLDHTESSTCIQTSRSKLLKRKDLPSTDLDDNPFEFIASLLQHRSVLDFNTDSGSLSTCVNDAFTAVYEATDSDYRNVEPKFNYKLNMDSDNVLFLTSVLRTQLEIDSTLKSFPELCISTRVKRCFSALFSAGFIFCCCASIVKVTAKRPYFSKFLKKFSTHMILCHNMTVY